MTYRFSSPRRPGAVASDLEAAAPRQAGTPSTQPEWEAYVAAPAGRGYLESDAFAQRWARLEERVAAGEEIAAADAAEMVGLPWPIFRHIYGHYMAMLVMMQGKGTRH